MKESSTILALETAIGGGSICIRRSDGEILSRSGTESVSRSEELLSNIKELLSRCRLTINDVDTIAVSRGPGSFTGIRIGIATALGLARSLSIPCIGIPVIDAIAYTRSLFPATVILPLGKNEVIWKTFSTDSDIASAHYGSVCNIDEVLGIVDQEQTIFIHDTLFKRLELNASRTPTIETVGLDLAKMIASNAHLWSATIDLSPIYLHDPAKRSNLF